MDRTTRWRLQLIELESKYARRIKEESIAQDFVFWDCYFWGSKYRTEEEKNSCAVLHEMETSMCKLRRLLGEIIPGPVVGAMKEAKDSVDSLGTKMRPGDTIYAVRQAVTKLESLIQDRSTQT